MSRRNPGDRKQLALQVFGQKCPGVTVQDLATEFRLTVRKIRSLVSEGRKITGKKAPALVAPLRTPRRWTGPPVLRLHGSAAGDMMALAHMQDDRTRDEDTHELQCQLDGEWETTDAGSAKACARVKADKIARIMEGRTRFTAVRVVERRRVP